MNRRTPRIEANQKRATGYFSYSVFALSLIAGIALGLSLTRMHGPLRRGNAEPWQLNAEDRLHYTIAIALEYEHSGDLATALNKLIAMRPAQDPLDALAEAACALGGSGYLGKESGITAVRSAVALYASQGRSGCAERLLPPDAADSARAAAVEEESEAEIATLQPTKPPLLAGDAEPSVKGFVPRPAPLRRFEARAARSFCDIANPALIELHVVDYLGRGIPGQRIRVRFSDREDVFLSGLKVDRGDSYADFQMQEGIDYAIDMPGAADALGASLRTGACYSGNRRTLKSWRVTFVEI
ncbi:MAG: hypothetical protein F4X87_11510 [Chloroflexi bacterium]|nr:hypothetical protein [Chloroflexota bacterium]